MGANIRRERPIGVAVPFSREQVDLFLCEVGVDHSKGDAVESAIPYSKERILPGVWHGQDVVNVQMSPILVPDRLPFRRWRGLSWVTVCPLLPNELVMLLAPHHTRKCLSLNVPEIIGHRQWADSVVKIISLLPSPLNNVVELFLVKVGVILS